MSTLNVSIFTGQPNSFLSQNFESLSDKHALAQRLEQFILSLQTGAQPGDGVSPPSITMSIVGGSGGSVQASGTFTFSAVASADDTVIINGVTFTAKASGATGNQFNIGADATASAANLAAAINASVTALVSGYVTASSALGVCTVTAVPYGIAGNTITIAEGVDAGSVITVSGARLTGGAADSSAQTISF